MHELSIVESIIQIAEDQAQRNGYDLISGITLEIGRCSGIELSAFDFAWDEAIKGSLLENAVRKINLIDAKSQCSSCKLVFPVENIYDICPSCGEICCELTQGKELKISSIELDKSITSNKTNQYV